MCNFGCSQVYYYSMYFRIHRFWILLVMIWQVGDSTHLSFLLSNCSESVKKCASPYYAFECRFNTCCSSVRCTVGQRVRPFRRYDLEPGIREVHLAAVSLELKRPTGRFGSFWKSSFLHRTAGTVSTFRLPHFFFSRPHWRFLSCPCGFLYREALAIY